jgi:hypothetical protein
MTVQYWREQRGHMEKLASELEYLDKTALDALKARAMAKSVGLVPHPGSQWKWGLRNMRDGQGNPLAGQALGNAQARIGKLPDNVRQNLLGMSNHVGPDKEIASTLHKGDDGFTTTIGDSHTVRPYIQQPEDAQLLKSIHTHPMPTNWRHSVDARVDQLKGTYDAPEHLPYVLGEMERSRSAGPALVSPSGSLGLFEHNQLLRRATQQTHDIEGTPAEYKTYLDQKNPTPQVRQKLEKEYHTGVRETLHEQLRRGTPQGDVQSMREIEMLHPGITHSIVNPQLGLESTHKVRFPGMRSIYWSGNTEAIAATKPMQQPPLNSKEIDSYRRRL